MTRKSLLSLLVIATCLAAIGLGTYAYQIDPTETSLGNTQTANTLDLTIDGLNGVNSVKTSLNGNVKPGSQPKATWALANVGDYAGFVDVGSVGVTDLDENDIEEPEAEAGDTTDGAGAGELQDVMNVKLFWDKNGDGWISVGDVILYDGLLSGLPGTTGSENIPLASGGTTWVTAIFDWWPGVDATDSMAMGDTATFNLSFELGQTSAQ